MFTQNVTTLGLASVSTLKHRRSPHTVLPTDLTGLTKEHLQSQQGMRNREDEQYCSFLQVSVEVISPAMLQKEQQVTTELGS